MKRFTVVAALFSIGLLAVLVIFQALAASPSKIENDHTPTRVYYVSDEMLQAIRSGEAAAVPVTGAEARQVAPVFDSSGAVVSDPTGTLWNPSHSADMKISPVYDATGALVSDPTGTIWNEFHP